MFSTSHGRTKCQQSIYLFSSNAMFWTKITKKLYNNVKRSPLSSRSLYSCAELTFSYENAILGCFYISIQTIPIMCGCAYRYNSRFSLLGSCDTLSKNGTKKHRQDLLVWPSLTILGTDISFWFWTRFRANTELIKSQWQFELILKLDPVFYYINKNSFVSP